MQKINLRTDLALDAHRAGIAQLGEISGAELTEFSEDGIKVSELSITDASAANALCKPIGKYFTIELENYISRREPGFAVTSGAISKQLKKFDVIPNSGNFLIACLGNRNITPDAVGPLTADSILVTRHLKSSMPENFAAFATVSVIRTGVLGTTGIESAATLKAVCDAVKPDCVIAIDALASSDISRLCKTVQICDSGIAPGSGVGNNRAPLNSDFLGIPVIAMGIPTVIDAAVLCSDKSTEGLFVTPRNIDELVASVSKLMAYSINLALHSGLSVEDIDMLIE